MFNQFAKTARGLSIAILAVTCVTLVVSIVGAITLGWGITAGLCEAADSNTSSSHSYTFPKDSEDNDSEIIDEIEEYFDDLLKEYGITGGNGSSNRGYASYEVRSFGYNGCGSGLIGSDAISCEGQGASPASSYTLTTGGWSFTDSSSIDDLPEELQKLFNSQQVDEDEVLGIFLGVFFIVLVIFFILEIISCIVSLIASILCIRRAATPERLGAAFGWGLASAILCLITGRMVTLILQIIALVEISRARRLAACPPPVSPTGYSTSAPEQA